MIQSGKIDVRKPNSQIRFIVVCNSFRCKARFALKGDVIRRVITYTYGNFLKKPIVAKGFELGSGGCSRSEVSE